MESFVWGHDLYFILHCVLLVIVNQNFNINIKKVTYSKVGDDESVNPARLFLSCFSSVSVSSDLWCTRCLLSCQPHTSLVWLSHWRLTPTFMTSMLEKDKACVSCSQITVNDHLELCYYDRWTPHSLCSCRKPRSCGPLVKVEVLNHSHHGHCPHICLCRPGHREHSTYTQPAQCLTGQQRILNVLTWLWLCRFLELC